MNRKYFKVMPFAVLLISIIVTALYTKAGYNETEATALNTTIREITINYRILQVVATMVLYLGGLVIVYPFCTGIGTEWAYVLAMPVGNAIWGVVSALVLFLNIPYNRYTMSVFGFLIILGLLYRYKENYKAMEWHQLIGALIIALSVCIMASSGVFAIFTSSDSYYFVMQYGELIAKHGKLSSDIVGTYMTWTGITPALMSSFAAMWGFENIYAMHYLLIFSMYGALTLITYQCAMKYYNRKRALTISAFVFITVAIIPAVSFLSTWIISNTYFMIYIALLMMLPIIKKKKVDDKCLCIMSLFIIWLALSRAETVLVMCFFIVCLSSLKLTKKMTLILFSPMCICQVLFYGKILFENLYSARQASEKLLTAETMAVIVLSLVLTGIYIGLYEIKPISFVRKNMTQFVLIALLISCLGLGLLDINKFLNNLSVVAHNVSDWYWKYVPITVLALEILKSWWRCRNKYFDLIVWGFVLCNFAVCMGRPQYLRLGIGDSYNRICMSILPLYVGSTILTFLDFFGEEGGLKNVSDKQSGGSMEA